MNIFFVHSGDESFVKLDRELLSASFNVRDYHAAHKFPAGIRQYWRGVRESDVLFCWFASWNSFWAILFARIMRKGAVLVIGGYDLANLPEAGYGHQRRGLGKWVSRFAMQLATVLVTFSYFSQREAEQNAGIPFQQVRMIYLGVPDPYGSLPQTPRARMALTVGRVDRPNLKRKGIEPFVRAAAYLPDVQFVVVGAWADDAIAHLRSIASPNVLFTGRVSDEELLDYYRQASVYVQASLHEGFGMSVAEAMLAGCIPVVTRAGSLPEVVGDCGVYCKTPNPMEITQAVEMALKEPSTTREKARERIVRQFPMEKRRVLLEQCIQDALLIHL